jgi:transposase-like protein
MGMFDTVMVPCPTCGERDGFQSKGGRCMLDEFTLEEAPDDVLSDVNRHAPSRCRKCNTLFAVEVNPRALKQASPPTLDQVREYQW